MSNTFIAVSQIIENNNIIGCRILDISTGESKPVGTKSIGTALSNGMSILNIKLAGKKLVGSNGKLDRLPRVDKTGNLLSKPIATIIAEICTEDNNIVGYVVADYMGGIFRYKVNDTIKLIKIFGVSNGKLVEADNKIFISSISGEYTKEKIQVQKETKENKEIRPEYNRFNREEADKYIEESCDNIMSAAVERFISDSLDARIKAANNFKKYTVQIGLAFIKKFVNSIEFIASKDKTSLYRAGLNNIYEVLDVTLHTKQVSDDTTIIEVITKANKLIIMTFQFRVTGNLDDGLYIDYNSGKEFEPIIARYFSRSSNGIDARASLEESEEFKKYYEIDKNFMITELGAYGEAFAFMLNRLYKFDVLHSSKKQHDKEFDSFYRKDWVTKNFENWITRYSFELLNITEENKIINSRCKTSVFKDSAVALLNNDYYQGELTEPIECLARVIESTRNIKNMQKEKIKEQEENK